MYQYAFIRITCYCCLSFDVTIVKTIRATSDMRLFSALEQLWPVASSPALGVKPTSGKENYLNGGKNSSKAEEPGLLQTRSGFQGSQTRHYLLGIGDRSVASPLGSRRSQATKHISTQPLCVPADSRVPRTASDKHSNFDEDKFGSQPNVSSEQVVQRIQTLLQPATPVVREVCHFYYRYRSVGVLMMGYAHR